jgi:alpha-mannosidase
LGANDRQLNESVEVNWKAIGTGQTINPTLAVAFDSPAQKPVARYEIPFGNLVRPVDGAEVSALRWSDFGNDQLGITVVNNGAYGYSAKEKTLRLRLIRSSFDPDPNPNPGFHIWRFSIVPRTGPLYVANVNKVADALNTGLVSEVVPTATSGSAPSEFSALSLGNPGLMATGLKLSEAKDGLILRFFEGTGQATNAVVKPGFSVDSAVWVNFIEDAVGTAKIANGVLKSPLRGFEIRTLKLRTHQGSAKAKQ